MIGAQEEADVQCRNAMRPDSSGVERMQPCLALTAMCILRQATKRNGHGVEQIQDCLVVGTFFDLTWWP